MRKLWLIPILLLFSTLAHGQILESIMFGGSNPTAATPTFLPVAGAVSNPTTVTASSSSGCSTQIFEDTSNPPTTLQNTFSVITAETVYAQVGGCPGFGNSAVGSAAYTIAALTPTFVTYTYYTAQNANPLTSPALTLSTNDGVAVYCFTDYPSGTPTGYVITSTPSHTFTPAALHGANNAWGQFSLGVGFPSGSTTFTCTPTGTSQSNGMVVLQYHNMPSNTINTSTGSTADAPSLSFSTSQRTLVIMCSNINNSTNSWAAGLIGGNSATLRGVDGGATLGSTSSGACEDYLSTTSMSSVTGNFSSPVASAGYQWASTLVAVNY
jgi:hypothetical protein